MIAIKNWWKQKVIIITEVLKLELTKLKLIFFDWNFFFNKFLFLFSSNLQTQLQILKQKKFLQKNDQKTNKQTNKKAIMKITCI